MAEPLRFEPGLTLPPGRPRVALWFIYRDNRLLVRRHGNTLEVPQAESPGLSGLQLVRRQFLGTADGRSCFSAELASASPVPEAMELVELRGLWGSLPEDLFWLAGRAFQVMDWDRTHQYCGRCASPMAAKTQERAKTCPSCGLVSYPRIAPAIIVAVVKDGQLLLARARRFPPDLYSVIAGFVDPGESLEECLRREVREEVGLEVKNLRYFTSQPWPFPNSLMVAFTAEYAAGELSIDGSEIVDAAWYPPDRLPRVPDSISAARKLIDWFAGTCGRVDASPAEPSPRANKQG